jgi:phosphoribosylanthranilate isomerase
VKATRIKICGVTTVADARCAIELGADAVGLNLFRGSHRFVAVEAAVEIARCLPPFAEAVAVVVQEPLPMALDRIAPIGRTVQWHGDDPPPTPPAPWRFIPAFNVAGAADLERLRAYLNQCSAAMKLPAAVVLDGARAGQFGGTGKTIPWELLAQLRLDVPLILAGGLTPRNVAEAVRAVRPYAVDVASGVESSPGRKDPALVRAFIDAVREADLGA